MFRLKITTMAILVLMPFYSYSSYSQNILEGFEELFELKESTVRMRNLDGSLTSPIPFLTSFNTLKLDSNNKKAIEQVSDYLNDNTVSAEYQQKIIDQLMVGIQDQSDCLGKLDECELFPETFEIVHNYNDQEVYVFVSPQILSYSNLDEELVYHSSLSQHNGLINSFDLYVSEYQEQDSIVSLNNETTLGLPYGYLKTDFNANNSDNGSELYEAAYHLDVDSYSMKAGHFEFEPEVNSTDFLNNTARVAQNSITVGTSKKLLVGGHNNDKVLSFYAPTSGGVQVSRDGRLIFQDNVPEGQNSIPYSKLPSGRYEVVLEVTSGGQVINTQTYQVYNTKSDSLTKGEVDFVASAGMFSGSYYDFMEHGIQNIEDDVFGKVLANYQLSRSLQIGLSGLVTDSGTMYTVGGAYNLIDWDLSTEAVYSQFEDASHLNANIGIPYLSLSYESLDNKLGDPIASYMYGYADYSRLSLNSSYSFRGGQSVYAVYSLNNDKQLDNLGNSDEQEQQFISVGYSTPTVLDSRVNINVDYSEATDDTSINLLWSVPLSDTVETIVGLTSDSDDINQFKTTVRRNQLIDSDSFNTSLEVSNTYARQQDDMYQDAVLATSGTTRYARMNASAHTSTNGTNGINAGLSSTQIVTTDGVYITDKAATSYTLVDIHQSQNTEQALDEKGYFTLKKEGQNNSKFIVYNDETIVPLESYSQYRANFDSESVDLYNSGDSNVSVFTHPGTVASIEPRVSRNVSFVSAFNDISEQPITEVECHGEGCIEVNEMADGVYRITVLEGMNFELSAKESQCLLPYEFTSTNQMNFGQNYCLPIAQDKRIDLIDADERLQAMYLGAYESSADLTKALKKLESHGYRIIQKEVGSFKAIYIAHESINMAETIAFHKRDIDQLKLLAKRLYRTNAITYPVAQAN
ncbi:TcfC E-set like domain-containing protein [Vibrio coralliirubri]|uniref:TcfC E-set like domain-containing protein n=1 Tax=Vibrio coralliirubri TaxID=1516159 RepID=UPI0009BE5C1F|nr:TcfC E-set like domain-containing protein [Vibrio coralliirubri]